MADPDEGMRALSSETAGGIQTFANYKDMISAGVCDALLIAAPNDTHHQIMLDVLETDLPILRKAVVYHGGALPRGVGEDRKPRRAGLGGNGISLYAPGAAAFAGTGKGHRWYAAHDGDPGASVSVFGQSWRLESVQRENRRNFGRKMLPLLGSDAPCAEE